MTNTDNRLKLPDYHHCLVNLANSVLQKFDVDPVHSTLPLADQVLAGNHRNTVILLLDALGTSILEKHLDKDGFFRTHLAGSFHSVFPPTTVAATTSLLSGLYPNEHGWLGWDMYYPKLQKNVTVFQNTEQLTEKEGAVPAAMDFTGNKIWTRDSLAEVKEAACFPVAYTYTPYQSIIERINTAGGHAFAASPFMPPYPEDLEAVLQRVKDLCEEPYSKFIYAYWGEPDSTMHDTGTVSRETHEMVISLEKKIQEFASSLSDTVLLIIADHGHMDSKNLCILDYPEVLDCLVRLPSIEPRALNLFVKEEKKALFPGIFRKHFGDNYLLLTRDEVLREKVFGIGEDRPGLPTFIGDYVAIATAGISVFNTHYKAQDMPGVHAGLTPEEYMIPLIVIEKE